MTVFLADRPFAPAEPTHVLAAGMTVAEIVAAVTPHLDLAPALREQFAVLIDGEPVPAEWWHRVRPRADRTVDVAVVVELHGDKALKFFASIALIAASIVLPGAIAGAFPALAGFGAAAITAGIVGAGNLLLSRLFQPPGAQRQDQGGDVKAASLSANVVAKGRALPRVAGEKRIYPPLISGPLTDLVGEDEYVEAVFALAGPHQWRRVRTGATLIMGENGSGDLTDIEIEMREGRPGEAALTLTDRYGMEHAPNVTLSQHDVSPTSSAQLRSQADPGSCLPKWHRVTSQMRNPEGFPQPLTDEIWVTLLFPEGLFDDDEPGSSRRMAIRSRIRLIGNTDWMNLPEVHVSYKRATPFRLMWKLIWGSAPSPLPTPPTSNGPVQAFVEVPVAATAPTGDGWQADSYFDAGSGLTNYRLMGLYSDRVEFYLSQAQIQGKYEIEFMRSYVFDAGSIVDSTYAYLGSVRDFFGYRDNAGTAELAYGQYGLHSKIILQRVASVRNASPAPLGGDALLAFRGKNRAFEAISAFAAGLVPDYSAATGDWSGLVATSNPAPHMRYALTGGLTADPLPDDLIDDAAFVAFRQHCIDEDLRCDVVLEGQSLWDALGIMAAAGWGEPAASDLWGVIWDRDRSAESPVQLLTPRNTRDASFAKGFDPSRPDALIVTFFTSEDEEAQITVYDDGVDPDAPDLRYEERRADWISGESADSEPRAEAWGLYQLRQARLRDVVYEYEAAIDARMLRRGDLIGVQDDVWTGVETGSAVIKGVTVSGGLVTGLVLDAEVPIVAEPEFDDVVNLPDVENVRLLGYASAVLIRCTDGTMLEKAIDGPTGSRSTVTFSTPFAMPQAIFDDATGLEDTIAAGCLVTAGLVGQVVRRCLIGEVSKRTDTTIGLKLVDEAPGIFA